MLDKIKQAMRMWNSGYTHGEISEVTDLSHEQEFASTELAKQYNLSAEHIYSRLPKIKPGMKAAEIEAVLIDTSPGGNW
jgi:hypothetical protein